jgi:hypothetical protein
VENSNLFAPPGPLAGSNFSHIVTALQILAYSVAAATIIHSG